MGKKTRNPNKLEKQALQARRSELEKIVAAHKAQQVEETKAAEDNNIDEDAALGVGAPLVVEAAEPINPVIEELGASSHQLPPVDLLHEEDQEADGFEVITADINNIGGDFAGMADQALADLNQAATGGWNPLGWIWGGK